RAGPREPARPRRRRPAGGWPGPGRPVARRGASRWVDHDCHPRRDSRGVIATAVGFHSNGALAAAPTGGGFGRNPYVWSGFGGVNVVPPPPLGRIVATVTERYGSDAPSAPGPGVVLWPSASVLGCFGPGRREAPPAPAKAPRVARECCGHAGRGSVCVEPVESDSCRHLATGAPPPSHATEHPVAKPLQKLLHMRPAGAMLPVCPHLEWQVCIST